MRGTTLPFVERESCRDEQLMPVEAGLGSSCTLLATNEPSQFTEIDLTGRELNVQTICPCRLFQHRRDHQRRGLNAIRVMANDVPSDQVSESASDKHVRSKLLTRGHPAGADSQGKGVSTDLNWLGRILRSNHPRKRPAHCCVAGRERSIELVITGAVRPESAPAITFIGTPSSRASALPPQAKYWRSLLLPEDASRRSDHCAWPTRAGRGRPSCNGPVKANVRDCLTFRA